MMTDGELLELIEQAKNSNRKSGEEPEPRRDNPGRYTGDETFMPPPKNPQEMKQTLFYYFGINSDHKFRTLVYIWNEDDVEDNEVLKDQPDDATLTRWIGDAKAGGSPSAIRDLSLVEWRRPGFLIFFVDLPGWDFLENNGKNKSLYFAEVLSDDIQNKCHGNYSFYNAHTRSLQVGTSIYKILVVENHHFKAPQSKGNGAYVCRKKDDPDDHYKFDIFLGVTLESASNKKQWLILDPGGKNMGPP
jgi:hypothetical protein